SRSSFRCGAAYFESVEIGFGGRAAGYVAVVARYVRGREIAFDGERGGGFAGFRVLAGLDRSASAGVGRQQPDWVEERGGARRLVSRNGAERFGDEFDGVRD